MLELSDITFKVAKERIYRRLSFVLQKWNAGCRRFFYYDVVKGASYQLSKVLLLCVLLSFELDIHFPKDNIVNSTKYELADNKM